MYFVTPAPGFGSLVPPGWMKSLLSVLQNQNTPRNVLLFLIKLILSCPDSFRPFANSLLAPLLALVGAGRLAGARVSIDYFTSDLLILLLSWSSHSGVLPDGCQEEKRSAGRVLSFLMKHIHHERRDILRHNMELLRSVLELWGPAVQEYVELDIVASLLSSGEPGVEGSGVQVLAALLVNRLGDPVRLGVEGFCQAVLGRLASRHRRVYLAAAETVGLLLARLQGELGAGARDRVARRLEMAPRVARTRTGGLILGFSRTGDPPPGCSRCCTPCTCTTPP